MWPFTKKRVEQPRMQTLGEMIAFSLANEATRTAWKAASGDRLLVGKDLGITIDCRWPRGQYCWRVQRQNGHDVPLPDKDKNLINAGIKSWRDWDDERKRANAMVSFVERFERAYGTKAWAAALFPRPTIAGLTISVYSGKRNHAHNCA